MGYIAYNLELTKKCYVLKISEGIHDEGATSHTFRIARLPSRCRSRSRLFLLQLAEALESADRPTTETRLGLFGRRFGRLRGRFLDLDGRRSGAGGGRLVTVSFDLCPHLT